MSYTIYVWPDDSWCCEDDLEQMTSWKSDDYYELIVPDERDAETFLQDYLKYVNTPEQTCPKCGETEDLTHVHHRGDFVAPECDYWICNVCRHQWGQKFQKQFGVKLKKMLNWLVYCWK